MSCVVSACAPTIQLANDDPDTIDQEAYAVYAAVLAAEPAEWPTPRIVAAETQRSRFADCRLIGENVPTPWGEAADDLSAKDQTGHRILSKLPAPPSSYVVLSPEQIAQRARKTGRGVPHIEFSNVGFDKTRTRAIVYREHVCGVADCGNGGHLLLEKHGGEWRLAHPVGVAGCGWIT